MIDTKTEELAALYVLDLLRGEERKEFEHRLDNESDLRRLVLELSTGLHAPIKQFNGPERLDLLDGIRERIGIDKEPPAAQSGTDTPPHAGAVRFSWIHALSAAAALLLVLNIFQYYNPGTEAMALRDALEKSHAAEQALLQENQTIKAFNSSWETEYMNIAQRMLPFIGSRDGLGQFTVIDLVDIRKGNGMAAPMSKGGLPEYLLSRSPLKFTSTRMPGIPQSSETVTVGYAVWKEDEHRGYLDLYNLGPAGPDRAPFLWLQGSSSQGYIPVGFIPDLNDGTGTFFFSVDQKDFVPATVLITEEPVKGPGPQPSRHHLMVGP